MEFNIDNLISSDKNTIEEKGKLKSKGGRPRINEVKNKRVMVYFTKKEYDQLFEKSLNQEMSLSNFIRTLSLSNV